ncbi:uncharacterized protein LOC129592895 isoform X2 [Paramacrobiotus metropolitanus]|uniref:uncharacterized protein LOC129592895 isoform X2 n=1 Tax=Paramacrobiotus metropolitanus TaxID=2943436 RepID=UPI00244575FA|nr:uncharacterized protein LOC129592895 isoform X2 [Paramacrobiotus metropolitanus]
MRLWYTCLRSFGNVWNLSRIHLPWELSDFNRSTTVYCNILRNDHKPLPSRKDLTSITLSGFMGEENGRPPFKSFLKNVQNTTKYLTVAFSKVGWLDADTLGSFPKLSWLDLSYNDIYDISADTFQPVVLNRLDGHSLSLDLRSNALQKLDLSVFAPLDSWLRWLHLGRQQPKMRQLDKSRSGFKFKALEVFLLSGNALTALPAWFLQSMPGLTHMDLTENRMCCSCCETQSFLRLLLNTSHNLQHFEMRCGPVEYTGRRNHGPGESHYRELSRLLQLPCAQCKQLDPVEIRCRKGSVTISERNLEQIEALIVHFTSDTTMRCNSVFHDIYHNVLELGNVSQPDPSSTSEVTLYCRHNRISVWGPDPDDLNPLKIVVDTDLSPQCHSIRVDFSRFITDNILSDAASSVSPLPVPAVVPIKSWVSNYLVCPLGAPLFINCSEGTVEFSEGTWLFYERPLNTTSSKILYIIADASLSCRQFVVSCHQYLLNAAGATVLSDPEFSASQDAIVAVCQRGRTVISESNPQNSAKLRLTYYSAPNDPCQKKFRIFLNYIQDASETLLPDDYIS